jgi:dienelactone hydrolase
MWRHALILACVLAAPWPINPARASEALQVIAPTRAGPGGTRSHNPLLGYLLRPATTSPRPAVVVLHGCGGFGAGSVQAGRDLQAAGYVALIPDSLGAQNLCQGGQGAQAEALDAYASLQFLSHQNFVQPDRVGLLGFSMGGVAALQAVEPGAMSAAFPIHFRAAVAYYPECGWSDGVMTIPVLVLIGEADDWASAADCNAMLARRAGRGAPVSLQILPNATHAFDSDAPPHRYLGHFIRYDPAATAAARQDMLLFYRQYLDAPAASSAGTAHGPNG